MAAMPSTPELLVPRDTGAGGVGGVGGVGGGVTRCGGGATGGATGGTVGGTASGADGWWAPDSSASMADSSDSGRGGAGGGARPGAPATAPPWWGGGREGAGAVLNTSRIEEAERVEAGADGRASLGTGGGGGVGAGRVSIHCRGHVRGGGSRHSSRASSTAREKLESGLSSSHRLDVEPVFKTSSRPIKEIEVFVVSKKGDAK